jgi:hypothetical protein
MAGPALVERVTAGAGTPDSGASSICARASTRRPRCATRGEGSVARASTVSSSSVYTVPAGPGPAPTPAAAAAAATEEPSGTYSPPLGAPLVPLPTPVHGDMGPVKETAAPPTTLPAPVLPMAAAACRCCCSCGWGATPTGTPPPLPLLLLPLPLPEATAPAPSPLLPAPGASGTACDIDAVRW